MWEHGAPWRRLLRKRPFGSNEVPGCRLRIMLFGSFAFLYVPRYFTPNFSTNGSSKVCFFYIISVACSWTSYKWDRTIDADLFYSGSALFFEMAIFSFNRWIRFHCINTPRFSHPFSHRWHQYSLGLLRIKLVSKCVWVELLGHTIGVQFWKKTSRLFAKWLYHLTPIMAQCGCSGSPRWPLPIFVDVRLLSVVYLEI